MPSQKLVDELEVIMYWNRQIKRRQQLFDQDATCKVCSAKIEHVEDCSNIKLANGSEHLCHESCFQMQLEQMALRFFGRAS